jgi:hypothetical protein
VDKSAAQLRTVTRRYFIGGSGLGLGAIALANLLADDGQGATAQQVAPLAARPPHFAPRVKNVIFQRPHQRRALRIYQWCADAARLASQVRSLWRLRG